MIRCIIFLIISLHLCADDSKYLPQGGQGEVIEHSGFILQYNNEREQASWVAYELTRSEVLNKVAIRKDNFRPDPEVDLGSALLSDYSKSGYDRGHLVPAADLSWSHQSMSDSFFLSNMSPQEPSFNRGIWKKLEEKVRSWALMNDQIYVVTGCLFVDDRGAIGASHVDIPSHYYKVIFDGHGTDVKMLAFVLENKASKEPLQSFVRTVDQVEELSGLDFFASLPDEIENDLEDDHDSMSWFSHGPNLPYEKKINDKTDDPDLKVLSDKRDLFWITTSSNKRHNSSCRYFKKSKGRLGRDDEGLACKSCGG